MGNINDTVGGEGVVIKAKFDLALKRVTPSALIYPRSLIAMFQRLELSL